MKAWSLPIVLVGSALLVASPPARAQSAGFENLHVLPGDISEDAFSRVMIGNLQGLGLRRRGGEGCLFCHMGSMDVPRSEWDYASDDKVTKRKARIMLAMTAAINRRLEGLEARVAEDLEVTCYTCHKGRCRALSPSSIVSWPRNPTMP